MGAGKLLIRFILGVIIASLLGVGIGTRVSAAPGTTIQGTLTLFTAIENIAVISSFTGDDNGNNRAILEYRLKGAAEWKPGIEMTADRRQAVISYYHGGAGGGTPQPNPYPNSWKAVIFWLTPNTEYEVRVTYSDPDGVAGSNPVIGTIRTRNDNPPSNGKKYFVSTTGNDSNDGLGPQTAWAKIQYAASKVQAGDTVSIMPGVYTQGTININAAGGTADNYITFQSYDMNNKAIIDGGGTVVWNIRVTVPYIRFRGLHVRNTASDGANIAFEGDDRGNPHFPIVEDSILEDSGQDHPGSDVFIRFAEGVLIQRNQMRRINRTATGSVGTSVYFFNNPTNPRGGHVVKGNSIIGSYRDGVGGGANAYWYGGPYINSYFYNNYIEGPYD
ncbi:MAG: hypothetical protein HY665_02465, partial [Chloroflexi bacterium]|nr:hypothetical protein [Chloroflexota bacterium]